MIEFNTVFGWLALISSAIIIIQLFLSIFLGGLDTDVDIDADGAGDFDLSSIISPKGILHYIFGTSWYLVLKPGERLISDYVVASLIGVLAAFAIAGVYYLLYKLSHEIKPESGSDLCGRSGKIYLKTGEDTYLITTKINGAQRELSVVSKSKKVYEPGTMVCIESYENEIYYIQ